jgi:hypothetical protein
MMSPRTGNACSWRSIIHDSQSETTLSESTSPSTTPFEASSRIVDVQMSLYRRCQVMRGAPVDVRVEEARTNNEEDPFSTEIDEGGTREAL